MAKSTLYRCHRTFFQNALGAGWEVVASVGHVRDLPAKEMAVDLQTLEPTYQFTERGAQVVAYISAGGKFASHADTTNTKSIKNASARSQL